MTSLLADLRYAFRGIRLNPLFTGIAVLSLALGIGANTAIFTLMDQLLLRQLPIEDPDSLVMLYQRGNHNGSNMGDRMHSYPIVQDYLDKGEPIAEILCRRRVSTSVTVGDSTERVGGELVSGNYFSMLGVKAAAGRLFNPEEDDQVKEGHPVVVLSYDYWVNRFSRDPNVVGSKILVSNYPMTVVGVSAEGFYGLDPAISTQIRVPIKMKPVLLPEWEWVKMEDRRTRWVQVFARLKPGFTAESAGPPMQVLFRQLREYESTLEGAKDWTPYSRKRFLEGTLHVEQAATGYSSLRNDFSTALVVLMCMVGLVLLIACANVANLLIARAFARRKEIAVRLSMGATRGRLTAQLLVESLVLSLAGGVAGVGVAFALTRGLLALIPSEGSPLLIHPEPDLRVLGFTLALTLLTGLIFGLAPALRASRPDPWTTLKDTIGSIAGVGGSLLLRKGLVVSQVALSFVLLFGAGLFYQSLHNLKATDSGFREMDNLITFQLAPALNGYDEARVVHFYEEVLGRLDALPGVKSAALASVPLLHGWEWDSTVQVEGHVAQDGENMQAFMNALSPRYFETMGVTTLEGRDFDRRDMKKDPKVAIVNREFAEHFFGEESALGRHLGPGSKADTELDVEIIGVAENTLYEGPREGVRRQVFIPNWGNSSAAFYVRTTMPSAAAYGAIRNAVKQLDASLPVYEMKTLATQLDQTLLSERLIALLSVGFGLLATLLAMIGLYGVMAFAVARRTKEVGVRIALGALPGSVVWLVMKEVLLLLGIGLAIGIPTGLGLGRFVSSQLYGIEGSTTGIAAAAVIALVVVSSAAGLIPAQRASRTNPILALRYE
jgi:putative ABC transport system permease protein